MRKDLIDKLRQRLTGPLPGRQAQAQMISHPYRLKVPVRKNHRVGGVLALFYPHREDWHLVFMRRSQDGRVHGGQVSFPGGKQEPEDPDVTFTALRESEEELGINPEKVEPLGQLSPLYIPPSNFMVYPLVGFAKERPDFVPDPREVADIIESPVQELVTQPPAQKLKVRIAPMLHRKVPGYLADGQVVWGATAMMLNELLELLRKK